MSSTLFVGPFAVPFALLLAATAVLCGALAARAAAGPRWPEFKPALLRAVWLGLLASRVSYVVEWHAAYLQHPLEAIDIRDGGFDAAMGIAVAVIMAIASSTANPAFRRRFAIAFAVAAAVWIPGTIALMSREAPRSPLPRMALPALDGTDVSLASFAGKPTIVNLWATWCPPCRHELPMLAQAQREHPEVNFVFIDQGESRDEIARYLALAGLRPANVLSDTHLQVGAALGQHVYPTTLFFDAGGYLTGSRVGELGVATLTQRLDALATSALKARR